MPDENKHELISEGMATLREILGGAEPYPALVHQYISDPEYRAACKIQLARCAVLEVVALQVERLLK